MKMKKAEVKINAVKGSKRIYKQKFVIADFL